ncbi:hypothetical protein Slin_2745 [Spirosoma linguale DSM 74]|uniref:Carboxypeptidase regulatory-like domain-containing protein n=1 Tax=Spirosoma linguale (strain ATCC 33905 / DSM 74 / LMG 10896 / Claus 1) TaxID=504472 RepID=D2QIH6_SPILD|nr:hypothetical protein Slin_2745 [Spirosoma linguale DSM 74]
MEPYSSKLKYYNLSGIILCFLLIWLITGCFKIINRKSEVQLTVQDSTGKPLPQVRILLDGYKPDFTKPESLETLQGVTDSSGVVKYTLSWPKGVSYYIILPISNYELINCPIEGNSPSRGECRIQTDRDLSATVQLRKRKF